MGSHEVKHFPGRVIAATNRDIGELRRSGFFRNDFYYRLSSNIIEMPDLARRLDEDSGELLLLVRHVLQKIIGADSEGLEVDVCNTIMRQPGGDYRWPGNIRELEQCVRRILLNGRYDGDSDATATGGAGADIHRAINEGTVGAATLLSYYCRMLLQRYGSYEKVASVVNLDRRTVKKYIEQDV